MPPVEAIDITQFDTDSEDVKAKARIAATRGEKSTSDYQAAIDLIKRSNSSRQEFIDALGDLERSLEKVKGTTESLLGQEGDVPPEIPVPEPAQPLAPIRGMRKK